MSADYKQDVYELFNTGEFSKAELGREFGVSPRTIGRWIEEVGNRQQEQKQEEQSSDRITEVNQLSVGDLVEFYDVKNSLPFGGLDHGEFVNGTTALVVEISEDWVDLSFNTAHGEQRQMTDLGTLDDGWKMRKLVERETEKQHLSVIMTSDFLSIGANGEADTITSDHPMFAEFYEEIATSNMDQGVLHSVRQRMNVKNMLQGYEWNDIVVDADSEKVMYKGNEVHGVVVQRIISSMHTGDGSIESLVKFLDLLMSNPSFRAVNELYSFLEAADIEIDSDGYVVCFKKVRENYTDIFSGKFDNRVGTTPSVERNQVDEDMNRTCSHGLHVCSASYLPFFGSASNDRIMSVRVNPADFVAIPVDYNYAKARVCRYEVLEDVTDSYYGPI